MLLKPRINALWFRAMWEAATVKGSVSSVSNWGVAITTSGVFVYMGGTVAAMLTR